MTTEETKTYYACYRGYVYLYTPFQAANDEEAQDFQNNLPDSPAPDMELSMPYIIDFEPDECYEPEPIKPTSVVSVPKPLAKQVIKSANEQGKVKAEAHKQAQIRQLQAQIDKAGHQLVIATASISDEIQSLQATLQSLQKG